MTSNWKKRMDIPLAGIILLAIFLNFYHLGENGSNTYYTAAAKSMTTNFKAFFFASLDPAGFITVDKPPVALWFQAISASIFGISDWSVLLPEAIAGVLSTLIIYFIVKPVFGRVSALWSSLILACTPIFVAVTRTNNVDAILILTLLIATWALMKSIHKDKISWLLLSVALVGVGFNIKMLQAYMVLPAFYLFYFLASKVNWKKRIGHLAIATVLLTGVSVSYAVVVDLIPEDEHPYIGGSQTNSVLELAFGYNGIQRLTGEKRAVNDGNKASDNENRSLNAGDPALNNENPSSNNGNMLNGGPPQMGQGGGPQGNNSSRGAGGEDIGEAGVFRLFSDSMSGQISWLLPFVLFSVIGVIVSIRKQRTLTLQHKFVIFWLAWLVPMMAFFSIASFFHRYYLSMMGPAIAALAAIGGVVLWDFYKEKQGWSQWLLPVALLLTFLFEAYVLFQNRDSIDTVWILFTGLLGIAVLVLMLAFRNKEKAAHYTLIAGMAGLLIMPLYWALTPVISGGGNTVMPVAGPASTGGPGGFGGPGNIGTESMPAAPPAAETAEKAGVSETPGAMPGRMMGGGPDGEVNSELLEYLESHYDGETYLAAVVRASSAAQMMMETDKAVMAMGGFGGSDPALTPEKLEEMTRNGEIKYFLISGDGRGGNSEVTEWIQEHCVEVPQEEWQSDSASDEQQPSFGRGGGMNTLYQYEG